MKPFYSVNFNASVCTMIISINGIPLINMEVNGQCSTRYPFNHLLLESGLATIKYEALPLKGELQLHKEAYLSAEVELFDLDSGYEPVSKLVSYETQPHNELVLPYIVHEEAFQVSVPYSIIGWKQSIKLDCSMEQLRNMVFDKYNFIIAMMENRRFSQYEEAFRERENIMGTCFYLTEAEKQGRMRDVEQAIMKCTSISPLSSLDFLEFAADDRLVRLIRMDGESSLRLMNEKTKEVTIIELWLHMKPGSNELTII